jgi:pimeloyl-ACP methyl ester carboxylesterase
LIAVSIPLVGIAILLGAVRFWSRPGRPAPFVDEHGNPVPGSVSEKTRVTVNGVETGMIIKSRDVSNPVLLYLHGGMPECFFTQRYPTGLEEIFTVIWWEQRGAGLSHDAGPPESMTAEQLILDTLELTEYLRNRFGKDRIYLLGHSGGSFVGIQAAARAPERYHAYIGVAQMCNQLKSEVLAYEYMLGRFKETGREQLVRKLEEAPVTMSGGVPPAYLSVRDQAMHSLGVGTTHDMTSVLGGIVLPSLRFPEYTVSEKFNLWRAKLRSGVSSLWDEILATDLSERLLEFDLPIYLLHGVHDYTCSYSEARAYFEKLNAPVKGFYTFARSAHSPMFEEPERTRMIIRQDILAGTAGLADST